MDFTIELTDEERSKGHFLHDSRQLAAQLLMCNGFVVLRGALPLELVTLMKDEFDDIAADCLSSAGEKSLQEIPWRSLGQTTFWIANGRLRAFIRMRGPFADSRVVANSFALEVMEMVLGPRFYCNSVSSDVCMVGSTLQSPHRDIGFYPSGLTRGTLVNIPLVHCGHHNGPLEIWPGGTHLWRRESFAITELRAFDQDVANLPMELFARRLPSVKLELFPGDLLLRDPGTLHRGTPNPMPEPRVMLTIGYFREGETYPFGDPSYNLDAALYDRLPPSVRQLMEFRYLSGVNYAARHETTPRIDDIKQ